MSDQEKPGPKCRRCGEAQHNGVGMLRNTRCGTCTERQQRLDMFAASIMGGLIAGHGGIMTDENHRGMAGASYKLAEVLEKKRAGILDKEEGA